VVSRNTFIASIISFAVGFFGATAAILMGGSGSVGGLAGIDRAGQQETEHLAGELERTVTEQRDRINRLEAGNSRLEEHLRNARAISSELAVSTGSEATDIRSAIILLKKITAQVQSLNHILDSGDTGIGGTGDMAGDKTGEVEKEFTPLTFSLPGWTI
jgi:hypothetical protein